jgi:hypothetical protein
MNNLEVVYEYQGRYNEAKILDKQVLAVQKKKKLRAEHPDMLRTVNNLALVYESQDRYTEAETVRGRKLGAEHPDTLTTMNNLVIIYRYQRRHDEVETLQKQVLAVRGKKLGVPGSCDRLLRRRDWATTKLSDGSSDFHSTVSEMTEFGSLCNGRWSCIVLLVRPQALLSSMMAFSHNGYVDARGSNFSQIGRDQNNITVVNNNINIMVFGSAPVSHVPDGPQWPTCRPDTLDRGRLPAVTSHPPNVGSASDIAGLIVQIIQALIDCRASSNDYRDLKLELESLHQMLVLTGLAIQAYESTPLGRTLAETINFEVEQCGKAVQELLSEINLYRRSLIPTRLRVLWSQVWYCGREKGELAQWRRKLSARRISIAMFLMALNSYALLIIHSCLLKHHI